MPNTYAKVIADSIYEDGTRITTLEVCFHRFVLAEFNTHRVFSRNSASSRAIPFSKQVAKLLGTGVDPEVELDGVAYPLKWAAEQKGMSGGDEVPQKHAARMEWKRAAREAIKAATRISALGVHKSVINRLLEPFMWHTVVVTSTAWENFLAQRWHDAAQPEIGAAADCIRDALAANTPQELAWGQWHTPYFDWDPEGPDVYPLATWLDQNIGGDWLIGEWAARVSAARCARVSYLTQAGVRDLAEDIDLHEKLVTRDDEMVDSEGRPNPIHWSPLEHPCTPSPRNQQSTPLEHAGYVIGTAHLPKVGNHLKWISLRHITEAEKGEMTFR